MLIKVAPDCKPATSSLDVIAFYIWFWSDHGNKAIVKWSLKSGPQHINRCVKRTDYLRIVIPLTTDQ